MKIVIIAIGTIAVIAFTLWMFSTGCWECGYTGGVELND